MSDTRRAAMLDALADHVLAHGLAASSLRPLAKAAGLSDRMLLYHFKDKNAVLAATLATIASRLTVMLGDAVAAPMPLPEVRARLVPLLLGDALWPYMRVWLEMAALAAQGDALFAEVGEAIGRGFYAWGYAQVAAPTPERRAIDAAQLLTSLEGMVLLKSIGMEDVARLAAG
nr:TetR/AcrR family transcriptional regulator [Polymorphobacter fuscus]